MAPWVVIWPIEDWSEPEKEGPPVARPMSTVASIERYETREDGEALKAVEYLIVPTGVHHDDAVRCWRFLIVPDHWRAFEAAGWKGAGQRGMEKKE